MGFGYLDGHRRDRRTHLVASTQDAWAIAEGGTNEDLIAKIAKLPLEAPSGTLFSYGLQQEVQGVIIQRISDEPLGVSSSRWA